MKLEIDVNLYVHDASAPSSLLHSILDKVTKMAVDLTALTAAVAAEDTVIDSAIALIGGIPALVSKAVADALTANGVADAAAQAAADAAAADIQGKTSALQTALTANTPNPPVTP
jgi:hypothetical protein